VREDDGRGWDKGRVCIEGGAGNEGICQGVYDEAPESVVAVEVSGGSSWLSRL